MKREYSWGIFWSFLGVALIMGSRAASGFDGAYGGVCSLMMASLVDMMSAHFPSSRDAIAHKVI